MKPEKSDLEELIEQQKWAEIREVIAEWQAPEIADLLSGLEKTDRLRLFHLLPRTLAGEVFSHLDAGLQESILFELTDEENRELLEGLQPDDRTHILERLPGEAVQKLLNLLSPAKSQEARQLLGYPEETVGRLMTPLYIAVRSGWTLDRALAHIRARGRAGDAMQTIYVVDARWRLIDALELQRFVLGDPSDTVEQIMDKSFVSLSPYDDREKAVEQIRKYDTVALPVVDEDGILLGVVTVDDVMDVAEEEVTEDFQIAAAVTPLRTTYREASAWQLYSKRMPWLLGLIVIYLFASGIVGAYEETLSAQIVLASFIPMLMGSGGNVGGQSGTLTVRALATGELEDFSWIRIIGKETVIGVAVGITMGIAGGLVGYWRGGMEIATIVALAMAGIVLAANIIGVVLPMILTRAGIDPAVAGSPLITSLADLTGLTIYFLTAQALLSFFAA